MDNNYLLEYADTFSYNKKVKEIISKLIFTDYTTSIYDLVEENLDNALEDLDTFGLFSPKKLVIIRNIELIDIDDRLTKHLLKYLDNYDKDKVLIMTSLKLDTRKKITKELKSKSKYIKLENDPNIIIKEELDGYKLEVGVISLLIEYTNSNIDAIKCECDKLKQYKYEEKEINKCDITSICYKHLTDQTQLTFDLVKDICRKNKRNALISYEKLHECNIDDLAITGLIESQLRLLEQVNILMDNHKNKKEIAAELDIHPYRIEKTMELLRDITIAEVSNLIKDLADIDYKSKSGVYDTKKTLEMLLLNL